MKETEPRDVTAATIGSLDTVFATLFRTTIQRASCGVRKLLRIGEFPHHLDICCSGGGGRSFLVLRVEAFDVALRPQSPYGLLRTGSPGRHLDFH